MTDLLVAGISSWDNATLPDPDTRMNPSLGRPRPCSGTLIAPETAIPTHDCRAFLRRIYSADLAVYMDAMEGEFLFIFQKGIRAAIE
jgi:hypothetical protein